VGGVSAAMYIRDFVYSLSNTGRAKESKVQLVAISLIEERAGGGEIEVWRVVGHVFIW
jgi:hypothetical protein